MFNSSNCQAQVANAPRSHLAQRDTRCPVQTLFEENKRSQKQAQKESRFQYLASFHTPCTSSLRALQAGALSRIPVISLLLENWAIFHKPPIQLVSSFVHGKVLEGKSQHPPLTHNPWHSLSLSVPPACPQASSVPSWLCGTIWRHPEISQAQTLSTSWSGLGQAGSQHIHFHMNTPKTEIHSCLLQLSFFFLLSVKTQFLTWTWNPDTN